MLQQLYSRIILASIVMLPLLSSCQSRSHENDPNQQNTMSEPLKLSENEWRNKLTPIQFNILRQKGTERPFTGEYYNHFESGVYHCAGCDVALFRSDTKFESGCGWPSFFEAATKGSIEYKKDMTYGMIRTEVLCSKCGGHLGHVFDDGPEPTGKRYCINSGAITFQSDKDSNDNSINHQ